MQTEEIGPEVTFLDIEGVDVWVKRVAKYRSQYREDIVSDGDNFSKIDPNRPREVDRLFRSFGVRMLQLESQLQWYDHLYRILTLDNQTFGDALCRLRTFHLQLHQRLAGLADTASSTNDYSNFKRLIDIDALNVVINHVITEIGRLEHIASFVVFRKLEMPDVS